MKQEKIIWFANEGMAFTTLIDKLIEEGNHIDATVVMQSKQTDSSPIFNTSTVVMIIYTPPTL